MYIFVLALFLLLPFRANCEAGGHPASARQDLPRPSALRKVRSLNGTWRIAFDPTNIGKHERWYDNFPGKSEPIHVPSVWNEIRPNYQGVAWYQTSFSIASGWKDKSVRMRFGAISYSAEVWLNGKLLGSHEGGYTPFEVDASGAARWGTNNQLIIRILLPPLTTNLLPGLTWPVGRPVDGLALEDVPSSKQAEYDNFGGIWQDVDLVATNRIWVQDCFIQPDIHAETINVQCQLQNLTGQDAKLTLETASREKQEPATPGSLQSKEITVGSGSSRIDFSMNIPHPKLWSPERPFLYTMQAFLLRQGEPIDSQEFDFGMREFTVREHRFYLNDHPLVVKGALYQPHYPQTLAYPPREGWLAEEIRLAKGANLNLLRLHVKTQVPRLLELADQQGMLVLEEPPIGWIRKSPQMRERCRREVEQLILRDRNHPSVVMWGVLNETGASALELKTELAALAHELDPTRPVIDDSGGIYWSGEKSLIWIPYQTYPREMNDLHPYLAMPFDQASFNYYRQLPQAHELNFFSEFGGLGGLEDLADVIRQYPSGHAWQDEQRLEEMEGVFRKGFLNLGLDKVFGDFSAYAKLSQEAQGTALAQMIDALRTSRDTSGYVITQFNDASFEASYGLLDEWRRPKTAYRAAAAANQPLHIVVSPDRVNQYAGEAVEVGLTIVNDEGRSGPCEIDLHLESGKGEVVYRGSHHARLEGRIQSLGSFHFVAPRAEGTYRLVVTLAAGKQAVDRSEQKVLVLKRIGKEEMPTIPITLLEEGGQLATRLANYPLRVSTYSPEARPKKVYVVSPIAASLFDYPLTYLKGMINLTRQGATLVLFELPPDTKEVSRKFDLFPMPVSVAPEGDEVLFTTEWIRKHPITAGLPANTVLDQSYAEVLPRFLLESPDGEVVAGASVDVFTLRWLRSLVVAQLGRGHLIICQFRILEELGRDPLADRLFINLLRYADSIASLPKSGLLPDQERGLERQVAGVRRSSETEIQQWAILGPFDNRAREGFERKYPPEASFDFHKDYDGKYGTVGWKPVTVWSSQHYHVPLSSRRDLSDWSLYYAFTQVYSPTEREARLLLTCQSGCRLWLNGTEVLYSDVIPMNENSTPVQFHAGWNRVLVKVDRTQMPESYFALNVVSNAGNPFPDLRFDYSPTRPQGGN
jgi:beta-galactosidase